MLANPQLVLEARLILLEHYLLVVICLVMVVFGVLMLTPSFSWVLPIVFLLPLRVGSIVVLAFTLIFMLFSMLFFRRVAATRSVLARHEGMRLVKEWRVASSITPVGSSSEVKSKSG
jgi:cytochrome b subunit of formate dehydrogenase